MKTVYTVKAVNKMVGPGIWEKSAEAMVTGPDVEEEVYVHVGEYDGFKDFSVRKTSMMDDNDSDEVSQEEEDALMDEIIRMQEGDPTAFADAPVVDGSVIEQYDKMSAAKESAYYPVFKMLNALLNSMEKEVK